MKVKEGDRSNLDDIWHQEAQTKSVPPRRTPVVAKQEI